MNCKHHTCTIRKHINHFPHRKTILPSLYILYPIIGGTVKVTNANRELKQTVAPETLADCKLYKLHLDFMIRTLLLVIMITM